MCVCVCVRTHVRKGLSSALARWVSPYTHLFDCVQHGPSSIPWLGGLSYTIQTRHAMPLPVLQLPVEGIGQHQDTVIQVEVGDLQTQRQ